MSENADGLNWRLVKLVSRAGVKVEAHPVREDQQRKRAPSEVGFHRFKATFITLSLDAGIPIPFIQKIAGNSYVRVLLKHYHRPDKKVLSEQMTTKLPNYLTRAKEAPSASAQEIRILDGSKGPKLGAGVGFEPTTFRL